MRIIAGTLRGRSIRGPEGDTTRPYTDQVRQALFSSLQAALGPEAFTGVTVLDAFCGTGTVGLECLSRGAAHCTFCEQDRSAIVLLQENLRDLGLEGRSRLARGDLLAITPPPAPGERPYRLVFLDPPYRLSLDCREPSPIGQLAMRLASVLDPTGLLVLRTMTGAVVPEQLGPLRRDRQSVHGTMTIDRFALGTSPA